MAVAVESSGTTVALTIGTELSLAAPTTAGVRQLVVDLAAMVAGDVVELRIKRMALAAGTIRTWQTATFAHVQSAPIVISVPVPSPHGATFTITQTLGTGRTFPWSVETM